MIASVNFKIDASNFSSSFAAKRLRSNVETLSK